LREAGDLAIHVVDVVEAPVNPVGVALSGEVNARWRWGHTAGEKGCVDTTHGENCERNQSRSRANSTHSLLLSTKTAMCTAVRLDVLVPRYSHLWLSGNAALKMDGFLRGFMTKEGSFGLYWGDCLPYS